MVCKINNSSNVVRSFKQSIQHATTYSNRFIVLLSPRLFREKAYILNLWLLIEVLTAFNTSNFKFDIQIQSNKGKYKLVLDALVESGF